jgi:pilus assembly protein Flp/PilA
MSKQLRSFCADEKGATAIEYSVIAAGIALAIITVVQGLGVKVTSLFGSVSNGFN